MDPRALERTFTIPERNRPIVREFRDAHEKGFMGKDGVRRWPTWGKTIVFAVTKRHAETLAAMLDERFADLKPNPATRYADFVVSDVGGGPAPDASAIIKRFKEEEFPKILVSVNMLDTGFDCPEVVSLVMARFTRSAILYRQMRGRGTRKAPHIGKTDFTIFDFVGVTDFHGDDDGDIGGGEAPGPRPPDPANRACWEIVGVVGGDDRHAANGRMLTGAGARHVVSWGPDDRDNGDRCVHRRDRDRHHRGDGPDAAHLDDEHQQAIRDERRTDAGDEG